MTMPTAEGPIRILILGGYGVFGRRLAHLLADLPKATLLIAGGDIAKTHYFCAQYSGQAGVLPLKIDRRDIAGALRQELGSGHPKIRHSRERGKSRYKDSWLLIFFPTTNLPASRRNAII